MSTTRRTSATAALLASRFGGVTAPELASTARCSERCAEETLRDLVAERVLTVDVPNRRGSRGPWPNRYLTAL